MYLESPIFDVVRIPSRLSLGRLIERICAAHGMDAVHFRARRGQHERNSVLDCRRDVLTEARAMGFAWSALAQWFGHRDHATVLRWAKDLGVADE